VRRFLRFSFSQIITPHLSLLLLATVPHRFFRVEMKCVPGTRVEIQNTKTPMSGSACRRVARRSVCKLARDKAEGMMEVHFKFSIAGEIKCQSVNIELWIKYGVVEEE
jgi:hypothetical protein